MGKLTTTLVLKRNEISKQPRRFISWGFWLCQSVLEQMTKYKNQAQREIQQIHALVRIWQPNKYGKYSKYTGWYVYGDPAAHVLNRQA